MALDVGPKAALFGFSSIIINDEDIRQRLSDQILLAENLRPDPDDYAAVCPGRSDRACLNNLLTQRGRFLTTQALDQRLAKTMASYQAWLLELENLPLYPGLEDLIFRCRTAQIPMGLVTGAARSRVESVLKKVQLTEAFEVVVTGDEIPTEGSKPAPDGYLKAIEQLNHRPGAPFLKPGDCLAVEASFAGIAAAKSAGIPVIGVAHSYPNHMLQRRANWVVDYLREIRFEWIAERFGGQRAEVEV